ncbi:MULTISPECIES: hypothetical protein [Campylobacter]|nr:hypothetical protein [Campylobacter helveticus]MDL0100943.1 hypothetical protein [Campylobacter felis]MCR2060491.1 hypothetical protein [Campylobacter helveticus]MCR2063157.1 hypothetical protein [Campylobacter helveticus]MCR2066916.1 hypothetical protein [Campylobacter helveticus]SMC22506.1 hypothetical protein SAMN02745125_01427 [Campylobacter helveticus]
MKNKINGLFSKDVAKYFIVASRANRKNCCLNFDLPKQIKH